MERKKNSQGNFGPTIIQKLYDLSRAGAARGDYRKARIPKSPYTQKLLLSASTECTQDLRITLLLLLLLLLFADSV
jgi:hypothetical protein